MRRSAFFLSFAAMVLMLASLALAKQTKVDVCHKGKGTISVAASAVPAHVGHGDTVCACAVIDDCAAQGGELDETTCQCVIESSACTPPGVCDTYETGCNGNDECTCATDTSGNGVCMQIVQCSDVMPCPNGQSDCLDGTVCIVATCCEYEEIGAPDICAPLCPPAP